MRIDVLDKGYVRFVEDWGHGDSDVPEAAIIEAARMSTAKGFNGWEKDEALLTYLYTHKHMTPFEMAGMTIEIAAPIMVFREWHRHRTQSYNEMSGRYIALPDVNYVPSIQRVMVNVGAHVKNKQAQSDAPAFPMTEATVDSDLAELQDYYAAGQALYEKLLSRGWPKELARLPVTVGRYSRMRASGNLRNWLAFMTLRLHPDAQKEIRLFAQAVEQIIRVRFPRTWKLFNLGFTSELT
jgi:thymidylate synthase (FAD)